MNIMIQHRKDEATPGLRSHVTFAPLERKLDKEDSAEHFIRFIQGANSFIALFQIYEIIRVSYLHYENQDRCQEPVTFLASSIILNLLWIFVALFGISAINLRRTRSIQRYKRFLFVMAVLRTVFSLSMILFSEPETIIPEFACDLYYGNQFNIFSAIFEGVAICALLFFVHTTKDYIKEWEQNFEDYIEAQHKDTKF